MREGQLSLVKEIAFQQKLCSKRHLKLSCPFSKINLLSSQKLRKIQKNWYHPKVKQSLCFAKVSKMLLQNFLIHLKVYRIKHLKSKSIQNLMPLLRSTKTALSITNMKTLLFFITYQYKRSKDCKIISKIIRY